MTNTSALNHREFSLLEWMKKAMMKSFISIGKEFGESPDQYVLALEGIVNPDVFSGSFPTSKNKIDEVKEYIAKLEKETQQNMFIIFHPHSGWKPEEVIATLSILKMQGLVESTTNKCGYRITKDGLNALTYAARV